MIKGQHYNIIVKILNADEMLLLLDNTIIPMSWITYNPVQDIVLDCYFESALYT